MEVVRISGLYFSYTSEYPVIQELSLIVREGEVFGIIGPNGAGKTTLLMLTAGLLKGNGRVELWGMSQPENFKILRKRIGFLFQNPDDQLFMPRVKEELLLELQSNGFPTEDEEAVVNDVLKRVGLLEKRQYTVSRLSLGEKKRLAIASLLVKTPELWLLDEPTSNLDPGMRREVIVMVRNLKGTRIIATHDLDLALEVCDRVLLLYKGKKIIEGDPNEILWDEEMLKRYGLALPLTIQGVKKWGK